MSLAVVQVASSDPGTPAGAISATFGVAPTNGNLLIAILAGFTGNGNAIINTGWTLSSQAQNLTSTANVAVIYKYAGVGESTTQQPDTRGWSYASLTIWEISGVSGTFATDHVADNFDLPNTASGGESTTSHNTANNNELIMGMTWAANVNVGASVSMTASGQTNDTNLHGNAGGFNHCMASWHQAEAISGTAFQFTAAWAGNPTINGIATFELKSSSAPVETTTVGIAIGKMNFAVSEAKSETSTANIPIAKMNFTIHEARMETTTVGLAVGKMQIAAFVLDLSALNKLRQFNVFG